MCRDFYLYMCTYGSKWGKGLALMISRSIYQRNSGMLLLARPGRAKSGEVERLCILVEQQSRKLLTWSSHMIRSSRLSSWSSSPSNHLSHHHTHICTSIHHQPHHTPLVHSMSHQTPTSLTFISWSYWVNPKQSFKLFINTATISLSTMISDKIHKKII